MYPKRCTHAYYDSKSKKLLIKCKALDHLNRLGYLLISIDLKQFDEPLALKSSVPIKYAFRKPYLIDLPVLYDYDDKIYSEVPINNVERKQKAKGLLACLNGILNCFRSN